MTNHIAPKRIAAQTPANPPPIHGGPGDAPPIRAALDAPPALGDIAAAEATR